MRRMARESIHAGERQAAAKKLKARLKKYGLTEADIDSQAREMEFFAVPANDFFEARLIFQVLAKIAPLAHKGLHKKPVMKAHGKEIFKAPMTKAEHEEFKAAVEHYANDFREQSEDFYAAYLHQQSLIVKVDESDERVKAVSKEKVANIARKMVGIVVSPHHKRLSDKK